ncbi:MAG: type II CRISPR RNA-guided endonuclease Cas9 [Eubacteriales bacterium]|nr:type II CRISPR RNA-guided endonuclease Cas9 [Eubacteriales bacterium]
MASKRKTGDYYLGLDIGVGSVGWAICDTDYNLYKHKGENTFGAHLYDEAKTAAERRIFRVARRRLQRRKNRLVLLQYLFKDEIEKVDGNFFLRLSESMFHQEDKSYYDKNSLFLGDFIDRDYHKTYPTIYHLRSELIHSDKKHDVRLVYLALHHIIKYRGHFLFEGDIQSGDNFLSILQDFEKEVRENFEDIDSFECSDPTALKEILSDGEMPKSEKQKKLYELYGCRKNSVAGKLLYAITGAQINLKTIFPEEYTEDKKIKFSDSSYEESLSDIEEKLGEKSFAIHKAKALHDWALLEEILKGEKFISDAKVEQYRQHKKDLEKLKKVVKEYIPEQYDEIFRDRNKEGNYCAYSGAIKIQGKKLVIKKCCNQADFNKFISKQLENIKADDFDLNYIKERAKDGTFMPKPRTLDNSVVPNQLHQAELTRILDNASKYLDFLNYVDEEGLSVKDKIKQILIFRIPYYVGPLNTNDKNAKNTWAERVSQEKIYPWNFEKVIDLEKSATKFINRMTAYCTYLYDKKVLPKNSILYSKFMVLNELNNLKIDGEAISVELKQRIYTECFENNPKVSLRKLVAFLNSNGIKVEKSGITGIDGDFKSSLKPIIEMKNLLGDFYNEDIAEKIIHLSTVLGEDRKMFKRTLKKEFSNKLTEKTIEEISRKRFTGWGRLSKEFLTEIYGVAFEDSSFGGQKLNVLEALWNTNNNILQLLSRDYSFAEEISNHNHKNENNLGITYDLIKDLMVSPSVKRSIWKTLSIVKELRKFMGRDPKKVFIEFARGGGVKGKRTESRRNKLLLLYKNIKDETRDWVKEIESREENEFRSEKLFLYYLQMGRCMYTGEAISIDNIFNKNLYDRDHIFPQSKTKDDSLDNLVLVKRDKNAEKEDRYPIEASIRNKMRDFWGFLRLKGLMSKTKYDRLMRSHGFEEAELSNFVARQLVMTRQSTKATADLLKRLLPESQIVYVRAELVSDFRHKFDMLKCREVNDLHHAKDAYLNIVVGNVYHTKFTSDPRNFFKEKNHSYNLKRMYEFPVKRGDTYAWRTGDGNNKSIDIVKRNMRRNYALITNMVYDQKGQLYDVNPLKKNQWQHPLKENVACFKDPNKYGGYNNIKGAHFMLVEHEEKGKKFRSVIDMPIYMKGRAKNEEAVMNMLLDSKGLKNPKVVFSHIGIMALLEIDGFRMNLRSRTNEYIQFSPAHQLIIGYENEKYLRNVIKFYERTRDKKDIIPDENYDGVSAEENLNLYNIFVDKLKNPPYSVFRLNYGEQLEKARGSFVALSLAEQCYILIQALSFFACNASRGNLSKLIYLDDKGKRKTISASVGPIIINRKISEHNSAKLIHQSITGLFTKEVDLLK